MKKKYFSLFLLSFLAIGLIACEGSDTKTTTTQTQRDLTNPLNLRHPDVIRGNIYIMVASSDEFDPRKPTFTGTRADERIQLLHLIEEGFNVNVIYEDFPVSLPWGSRRSEGIRGNISLGTPLADAYFISSEWLPQLSDYLQPVNALMDARNKVQPYTPSFISLGRQSFNRNLFGITSSYSFANNGIYFNETAINFLGLPNPVDIFLVGNWTNSAFREWTEKANRAISENADYYSAVFTGWTHIWLEGLIGSHGGYIVSENYKMGFLSPAAMSAMELLRFMSASYDDTTITDQGSANWRNGRALMSSMDLISFILSFTGRFNRLNFDVGFVPFPVADNMHSIDDFRPLVSTPESFFVIGDRNNKGGVSQEIIYNVLFSIAHGLEDTLTPEQSFQRIVERYFSDERYIEAYLAMNRSGQGFFDRWTTLQMGFADWNNTDGFIQASQELAGIRSGNEREIAEIAQAMSLLGNNVLDMLLGQR